MTLCDFYFPGAVTGDRNVSFQQDIPQFHIAVLVLAASSTQLKDTLALMLPLLAKLPQFTAGHGHCSHAVNVAGNYGASE